MAIQAQRIVVRIGMSAEIPALQIGEAGWDVDKRRLRIGDGTTTPPMLMTDKSIGPFKFDFIDYVEYPEIRMLPDGTVDGVDISDLNQTNGYLVRRGNNLWAARTFVNDDGFLKIVNPDGVVGNTILDLSDDFKSHIARFLEEVAVDDITIHGNGRPESPLFAQTATKTLKGVAELATVQETIDGVDDTRIVTPADLQAKKATTAAYGIVRFATPAEVAAGTPGVVSSAADVKSYVDSHSGFYVPNISWEVQYSVPEPKGHAVSLLQYPIIFRVLSPLTTLSLGDGHNSGGGGSTFLHGYYFDNLSFGFVQAPDGQFTQSYKGHWTELTIFNNFVYGIVNGSAVEAIAPVQGPTIYCFGTSGAGDGDDKIKHQGTIRGPFSFG